MQTSYDILPNRAVAGMLANLDNKRVATFNNPTDRMLFGQFGARVSSDDNGCKLPAASGDVILGVVLRDLAVEEDSILGSGIAAKGAIPILHEGEVWIACEEAIAVGDTPYIVYAGRKQVQTITLSTDLITANVITTTVNGKSVASTYATSHAATATAHAALIAALDGVSTCTVTGDVFTVTAELDVALTITCEVTLGASQPTVTIAETVVAKPSTDCGMLRNDADTSRALDASAYVKILEYDSTTGLARCFVRVLA